jgi:hypothetical protein
MQRAFSVVRLALSLIGRSQQKQYIMFYNTVVLARPRFRLFSLPAPERLRVSVTGIAEVIDIFFIFRSESNEFRAAG